MMDNQALVDALIKFQSWCDNWPKIRAEIDAQAAENAALRDELETERMRLAGCSVAALSNTPKTAAERLARDHPYWSASYQDVCNIVDSEMALRARLAEATGLLCLAGHNIPRYSILGRHINEWLAKNAPTTAQKETT